MGAIENLLNTWHFCFYRFHYELHLVANKINPFRYIVRIPYIKRKLEEKGVMNIENEINKAFGNKKYGLSVTVAGGALIGILFFFFLAAFNIALKLLLGNIVLYAFHFVFCGILSITISYIFVLKRDNYLKYFERYEGWEKGVESRYMLLSVIFVLLVFCLFILSLKM